MQKKFSFIFFGAGPNQIAYIKHSFKKKNYNIVIHNKNSRTVSRYADKYFIGSVYKKKNVLNICKKIKKYNKVDDIVCRSTGPSIISAAAAFNYLNIKRVSNKLAKCIYSKHYFHKFLQVIKIPSIKSALISKNKKKYPKGTWVLKPDCPLFGKIFVYKISNQKLDNKDFTLVKNNSDNKKGNLSKYIPGIDVTAIYFIKKKNKQKIMLNLVNEWNFFVKNEMYIYNNKSVPGLSSPELLIKFSEKKKIINYSSEIISQFPDYYGLIAITYRVNNGQVYAYEININVEKRYSNIIFPHFYNNLSIYDLEISNLMGKKLSDLEYKKKNKFIGIFNNKKIINKKLYLNKINKFFKN